MVFVVWLLACCPNAHHDPSPTGCNAGLRARDRWTYSSLPPAPYDVPRVRCRLRCYPLSAYPWIARRKPSPATCSNAGEPRHGDGRNGSAVTAGRKRCSMLTGRLFKLSERTLAIDVVECQRIAVTIPAGAIIKVLSGNDDQTVDVLWESRRVEVFSCDVNMRGTEITMKY